MHSLQHSFYLTTPTSSFILAPPGREEEQESLVALGRAKWDYDYEGRSIDGLSYLGGTSHPTVRTDFGPSLDREEMSFAERKKRDDKRRAKAAILKDKAAAAGS